VTGACTTAVKNAAMPTTAKAVGSRPAAGMASLQNAPKNNPSCAPQHQDRGEQAAWYRRRIRHSSETEAQHKSQWEHGEDCSTGQGALRAFVPAADQRRHEEAERPNQSPDGGRATLDRPAVEPVHHGEGS